jgi:hypothetical protein
MPAEIEAFLGAYQPKFICLPCLGAVTARAEADGRVPELQPDGVRRAPTGAGPVRPKTTKRRHHS